MSAPNQDFWNGKLLKSIGENNRAGVEMALANGANPNCEYDDKSPALFGAAFLCSDEITRLLVDKGADVSKKKLDGYLKSALHYAACNKNSENAVGNIELLLERGINIDTPDRLGQTPLFDAVECGTPAAVQYLLDRGADANKNFGKTRSNFTKNPDNVTRIGDWYIEDCVKYNKQYREEISEIIRRHRERQREITMAVGSETQEMPLHVQMPAAPQGGTDVPQPWRPGPLLNKPMPTLQQELKQEKKEDPKPPKMRGGYQKI